MHSCYEYQVILFTFSNLFISFSGYINKILIEKLNIFIIIYLNNILIQLKTDSYNYIITFK